jgi:parallel beta-helix repeat protein
MVMANSVGVYGFGISGTTDKRLTTPWSGGISAWLPGKTDSLSDITIRDNKIAPLGGSDAEANSTSSAGIFVSRVSNFLVAGNTVQRTLADGIHITAGSSNGRVVRNTVRESGDDMIAVVSYLPVDKNDPDLKQVAANLPTLIQQNLDHDILIEGNDVSGQYWGRGITVVGGKDVTIRNNSISNTSTGAAVYLAREASYSTFGVTNVVVEDNTISHVQTVAPTYTPPNWSTNDHRKGGHAAIFVLAQTYDFEEADPGISNALKVAMIRIENNKIDDTAADGIRIGTSTDLPGMRVPRNLNVEAKRFAGRPIGSVAIIQNQLTNVRGTPMQLKTSGNQQGLFCDKNSAGAGPSDSGGCGSAPIKVTGAPQSCQTQH